ncbi:unnamed protein product, partial [Allacma fusca]
MAHTTIRVSVITRSSGINKHSGVKPNPAIHLYQWYYDTFSSFSLLWKPGALLRG